MYGRDVTEKILVESPSQNHASDARPERSEGRSNATRSMSEANATLHFGTAERACAFFMAKMNRTTRIISLNHFVGVPSGLLSKNHKNGGLGGESEGNLKGVQIFPEKISAIEARKRSVVKPFCAEFAVLI